MGRPVGWSILPISQGFRFYHQSGHTQESTNECIDKWNNSLSLSLSFSLSQSQLKKKRLRTLGVGGGADGRGEGLPSHLCFPAPSFLVAWPQTGPFISQAVSSSVNAGGELSRPVQTELDRAGGSGLPPFFLLSARGCVVPRRLC